MIHRAPFGSMERFVAVLIEHCGGNFPLWLSPEQIVILPISEKFHDYANKVLELLKNYDICGRIDKRSEKTGRKIRDAELVADNSLQSFHHNRTYAIASIQNGRNHPSK